MKMRSDQLLGVFQRDSSWKQEAVYNLIFLNSILFSGDANYVCNRIELVSKDIS